MAREAVRPLGERAQHRVGDPAHRACGEEARLEHGVGPQVHDHRHVRDPEQHPRHHRGEVRGDGRGMYDGEPGSSDVTDAVVRARQRPRGVVQHPAERVRVVARVQRRTPDLDPVDHLAARLVGPVALGDDAGRVVRHSGQHGHVPTHPLQLLGNPDSHPDVLGAVHLADVADAVAHGEQSAVSRAAASGEGCRRTSSASAGTRTRPASAQPRDAA